MTQLPTLKARKIIKIIEKYGFVKVRQEGSHIFFKQLKFTVYLVSN